MFVLRHLLPVPINRTFDRSVSFWIYQHPFPYYPMHPKSWAQSISKYAPYFLHIFWVYTKSGVSESIENNPYVTTKMALTGSAYLVFWRASTIALWLRWGNLIIFLVAALAPSCRQLWESWSMMTWSYYLTKALITPNPANHPAE